MSCRLPSGGTSDDRGPVVKVGFVCREYPAVDPHHGGIGAAVETLAHRLTGLGYEVHVFAVGERQGLERDGGVEIHCLKFEGVLRTVLELRRALAQRLRSGALDVIEAPESEAHLLPGGRGSVVRMNGSHHFWCAHLHQKRRFGRLLLEQWGVRRASGLCAVSSFCAEETRRLMRLGPRSIRVLPNPIDTEFFRPDPADVRPARIVFVGTVTRKKGVIELCRAFDSLRLEHGDAELRLVGRDDGPEERSTRARIEAELSEWGHQHITFLGAQIARASGDRDETGSALCLSLVHGDSGHRRRRSAGLRSTSHRGFGRTGSGNAGRAPCGLGSTACGRNRAGQRPKRRTLGT